MNIAIKPPSSAIACALVVVALSACSDKKQALEPVMRAPSSTSPSAAGASAEPLPPEQAFQLKVQAHGAKTLVAQFTLAPGHYLYKSKISFALKDATGARLEAVSMPAGVLKKDPFLGDQEVYPQPVEISLPLARETGRPAKFTLIATYQGCNEKIGLCYAPIETSFNFNLP